jgi:hypothetical protein
VARAPLLTADAAGVLNRIWRADDARGVAVGASVVSEAAASAVETSIGPVLSRPSRRAPEARRSQRMVGAPTMSGELPGRPADERFGASTGRPAER